MAQPHVVREWKRRRPGEASYASWSPDGTRLVSAHYCDAARFETSVWTASGEDVWTVEGIHALRWSPDSKSLVCNFGALQLLDAGTGRTSKEYDFYSHNCVLSADGRRAAVTGGHHERMLHVVNLDSGVAERERDLEFVSQALHWAPTGDLAIGDNDGHVAILTEDLEPQGKVFEGNGSVWDVCWSPHSSHLAVGSAEGDVRIWDVAAGHCLYTFHERDSIRWVAWSPDGRFFAGGSDAGRTLVWELATGTEVLRLESGPGVSFHPRGGLLATTDHEKVRIWDISDLVPEVQPNRMDTAAGLYLRKQSVTVGRRASVGAAPERWVPTGLPGANESCLGELVGDPEHDESPSVFILPNGKQLLTGHTNGAVRIWELTNGRVREIETERGQTWGVAVDPGGEWFAVTTGGVARWSISGERAWQVDSGCLTRYDLDIAPDGQSLAVGDGLPGGGRRVSILSAETGQIARIIEEERAINAVRWSASGMFLGVGGDNGLVAVWNMRTGALERRFEGLSRNVWDVSWSLHDEYVAAADEGDNICVWNVGSGQVHGKHGGVRLLWHSDGETMASLSQGTVRLWNSRQAREIPDIGPLTQNSGRKMAFSPDSAFLVVGMRNDRVRIFDTRDIGSSPHAVSVSASASLPRMSLPADLRPLPVALAELHRLHLFPPLSLLRDLLNLIAGLSVSESLQPLASHPGIRALAALRWPVQARTGLAALLLHEVPFEGWDPPGSLPPTKLRAALTTALETAQSCPAEAPPPPLSLLQEAAARVDDRLITLLELLTAEAVAAEPGLPLRMLSRVPHIRPVNPGHRRLLGLRLLSGASGQASGSGSGVERGGIDLRGDLRALLPSQLVLPQNVLAYRHLRGELLYRARLGAEPPKLRPTVLLLDTSPPCFGPVEALTRLAAHTMASTLREAGIAVVLITAGGDGTVRMIECAADLVDIWTARSYEEANLPRSLAIARGLREQLRDGGVEPVVMVLSHAWCGAEDERVTMIGLRGLFVQYPGQEVRPAIAEWCERWESLAAGNAAGLADALGRLAG